MPLEERRREQNRLAQRRFRQKHRQRKGTKQCEPMPSPSSDSQQETWPGDVALTDFPSVSYLTTTGSPVDSCLPVTHGSNGYPFLDNISSSDLENLHTPELELEFDLGPNASEPEPCMSQTPEVILDRLGYDESFLEPNGGEDVNSSHLLDHDVGSSWQSPLHIAVQKAHGKIVRLLLKHHADCNNKDSEGLTPLIHATIRGHDDIADLLLSHGAGIQYVDHQHQSPLHLAVVYRRDRLLKKLLQHCGGDSAVVNSYTKDGRTPLHIAIDMGFEAAVEVLLESGANVQYQARNPKSFSSEIHHIGATAPTGYGQSTPQ